jgi:hypothetical protein
VYSDDTASAGNGGTATVSGRVVPASGAVTLTTPGTYWQASYSEDPTAAASTSTCGSEVETVTSQTACTSGSLSHPATGVRCDGASYGDRPQSQPPR